LQRGLKIIDDFAEIVKANRVKASIKLQFRDVDGFIHRDYRDREDVRYIAKTLATRLPWNALRAMIDRVRGHGMIPMVTPFDEFSVDKCVEFDVEVLKIASSDIRDKTLLRKIASAGLPVIASSGGADDHHVDALVSYFTSRGIPFALNHCVSIYPSEDGELELNQIDYLRSRYPHVTVGLSTHEHRNWHDSILIAYAKGARTFERHIDIDDDGIPVSPYCSLPEQADTWFKAFNKAREMCGGGAEAKRNIPAKEREYLDRLVRGVYAKRNLPAGHRLTEADVYFAVPLLKGQVSTREFEKGELLNASLAADEPIFLDDITARYGLDPEVLRFVPDRGMEPRTLIPREAPLLLES
jgi:N-acetylneuraminate synthase